MIENDRKNFEERLDSLLLLKALLIQDNEFDEEDKKSTKKQGIGHLNYYKNNGK